MLDCRGPAAERGGNTSNGFLDFCYENGSSQGQHLALTGLSVASSFDSGVEGPRKIASLSGQQEEPLKSAIIEVDKVPDT